MNRYYLKRKPTLWLDLGWGEEEKKYERKHTSLGLGLKKKLIVLELEHMGSKCGCGLKGHATESSEAL